MWARLLPHVTKELYQRLLRTPARSESVHVTPWPDPASCAEPSETPTILGVLDACRSIRNTRQPQNRILGSLIVDTDEPTWALLDQARPTLLVRRVRGDLRSARVA
jgi:valyl-tRNA synthetase